tara:strand:- start:4072 stop:4872 length:801 start_codon:yes stop_codon:yes gene_type:complete
MFQYAALRGIADYHGYEWMVPVPNNYGTGNYGLFECFNMSSVSDKNFGIFSAQTNVTTGQFHFSEGFYKKCPDNVNIHDYFQTEKYFKNVEALIRSDYTFKDEIVDACKEVFDELKKPIFIHVRRGDYVNQPQNHPPCPISYYEKSLKHFDDDCEVLVFSDDIDWCKKQEFFSSDRFLISEFEDRYEHLSETNDGNIKSLIPYYDLCMMTMCTGGIIANSSMSWWGAWLIENPTQPIVSPNPWFGENYSHFVMEDLIPDRWVIQDV